MDEMKAAAANPSPVADFDNADLSGRVLGDYQIVRRIGKGGMGQVFLAEQISLKRKVALKFLRADLARNPEAVKRFRVEAEAVARVTHANIVQVYAIGEVEGLPYMALEYIEGRTLREFVEKKGPPDLALALGIMRQGASALLRAAELGIVHRDIKPDNILLTRKGEVKIADFGLARVLDGDRPALNLTQSGVVMGTPLYMSPEQVEGKALDARSDIYSFGVTCYHMLTGQPPFRGATAIEVALQHLQKEPPALATLRPDLPESLHAIVRRMMAKDPAQRYQTSRELLREIVRLRENVGGAAAISRSPLESAISVELLPVPPSTPLLGSVFAVAARAFLRDRRRWLLLAIAASLVVALSVGAVLGFMRKSPKPLPATETPGATPATDIKQLDAILGKKRREEGLLAALDPFLAPESATKPEKFRAGFELAMELSLFYLDEQKLEEGKRFFGRLESIAQVRAYNHLGRTGRAIVLALQNKPTESNGLLRELAGGAPFRDLGPKRLEKMEAKKNPGPMLLMLFNPRFQFWIAEALYYNQRNGIDDKDVPAVFLRYRRQAESAAKK